MSDLISRQAAIDAIHNYWAKRLETLPTRKTEYGEVYGDIKSMYKIFEHNKILTGMIKQLSSVQPQIIHCKDCRWWTNQSTTLQGKCKLHGLNPMPEWYCASGAVVE